MCLDLQCFRTLAVILVLDFNIPPLPPFFLLSLLPLSPEKQAGYAGGVSNRGAAEVTL